MFKLKLLFVESFDSEFKDKKYKIYTFVEPTSLKILYGTDLDSKVELKANTFYKCTLQVKNNKIKVIEVTSAD